MKDKLTDTNKGIQFYLWVLVLLQFTLLFFLIRMVMAIELNGYFIFLYILTLIPALWAIVEMRSNKWGIHPQPKNGSTLIQSGPYAYMRHPMYTSLSAFALVAILNVFTWEVLMLSLLLFVTIRLKIREEERLLIKKYPEYKEYSSKVGIGRRAYF